MTTVSIVSPEDSKYRKNVSYPNDLVHVATNSRNDVLSDYSESLYSASVSKDMPDLR